MDNKNRSNPLFAYYSSFTLLMRIITLSSLSTLKIYELNLRGDTEKRKSIISIK